jgi:soluble lytic murein transglycosylase-like protein
MSAQAVAGIDAGELAVAQRVQQLQALIEAARLVASPDSAATTAASSSYTQTANAPFASALQAATSADASEVADPSGVVDASEAADTTGVADSSGVAYQAVQGAGANAESSEYESLINQAAARYGLDPAVLHGLIQQESGFDPTATSSAGASGLTQLMPGTASSLGVANPLNPAESIEGGARYLSRLMGEFGGSTADALAAYNAGPGAVQQYGGIPPYAETQSYVSKVLGYAEAYRQSHPTTVGTGSLA